MARAAKRGMPKQAIGIEIGRDFLKGVVLSRRKDGAHVEKLVCRPLPPDLVNDEGFRDLDEMKNQLEDLLEEGEIDLKRFPLHVSLYERAAIVRLARLPAGLNREELARGLQFAFRKELPLEPDELSINYLLLEGMEQVEERQLLILAMKRTLVEQTKALFWEFKKKIDSLELPYFGLSRYQIEEGTTRVWLLLRLGERITDLTILDDGLPYYSTTFSVGLSEFEQLLSSLSVVQGENKKEAHLAALEPVLTRISIEVLRAFKYYETLKREKGHAGIYLVGSWNKIPNLGFLMEALRGKLNVHVGVPSSGERLVTYSKEAEGQRSADDGGFWGSVIGLAMREFMAPAREAAGTDSNGWNLLVDQARGRRFPQGIRRGKHEPKPLELAGSGGRRWRWLTPGQGGLRGRRVPPVQTALITAVVLLTFFVGMQIKKTFFPNRSRPAAALPAGSRPVSPQPAAISRPLIPAADAAQRKAHQTLLLGFVHDLAQAGSEDLWLREVTWNREGTLGMTGGAYYQSSIFILMSKLNGSRFVENVLLDDMKGGDGTSSEGGSGRPVFQFTFKGKFQGEKEVRLDTAESKPLDKSEMRILATLGKVVGDSGNQIVLLKRSGTVVAGGQAPPSGGTAPQPGTELLKLDLEVNGSVASLVKFLGWVERQKSWVSPVRLRVSGAAAAIHASMELEISPALVNEPRLASVQLVPADVKIPPPGRLVFAGGAPPSAPERGEEKGSSGGVPTAGGEIPAIPGIESSPGSPQGSREGGARISWRLKGVILEPGKPGVALLEHDGKSYFMRSGESREGVRVLSVSQEGALIQVGEEKIQLTMPKEKIPK